MKIIWNKVTWYSKALAFLFIFLVFFLGFIFGKANEKNRIFLENLNVQKVNIKENESILKFCYKHEEKETNGFDSIAWLVLNILDGKIFGEYHNLPALTDSKFGTFEKEINNFLYNKEKNLIEVLWHAESEGVGNKEKLLIEFGDDFALVLFGEMVFSDGIYVYKDKNKLNPGFLMNKIDCNLLYSENILKEFLKDNINLISIKKPVLGGNWYLISLKIKTYNNQEGEAEIFYEDGHIQNSSLFTYKILDNKKVEISNWKELEI